MTHLARATAALGALAIAVGVPAAGAAKQKPKPKHTATVLHGRRAAEDHAEEPQPQVRQEQVGDRRSAHAGRATSASGRSAPRPRTAAAARGPCSRSSVALRRRSSRSSQRRPRSLRRSPRPRRPTPRDFRLTLLHNNDGESKYVVGDSIAGYGGITRFKTVLDRLRSEAGADVVAGQHGQGHRHDQLGRQLPRRPEPARVVPALRLARGAVLRLRGDRGHRLRRGHDRQPRVRLRPRPPGAVHRVRGQRRAVPVGQHRLLQRAVPAGAAQQRPDRRLDDRHEGRRAIGIIGVSPPETPSISAPRNVTFNADVAGIVNAEAQRLTEAGVNKIILSSHLQDTANERAVVTQLKNIDIVISAARTTCWPTRATGSSRCRTRPARSARTR